MKRVLLTGATGFIGSFLLKELLNRHNEVIVIKRSTSDTSRIKEVLGKVKSYNVDSTTLESIFLENKNIDLIIHLATSYGRNGVTLSSILHDNVIFPVALAEIGFLNGCRTFINTDSFFGKGSLRYEYLAHYTLSKRMSVEALKVTGVQLINCRLEHVYGPSDDDKKFVTSIVQQLLSNKVEIDLTDGKQKRDFIYVDDVVSAFCNVIANTNNLPLFSEIEIGTGNSISIFDFVTRIKQLIPQCETILNWGKLPQRTGEFSESSAEISKLSSLGWKQSTSLESGILQTINYYNKNGV